MVCAPVRSIIPSLKLGDYLSVQAHKPCSVSHIDLVYNICFYYIFTKTVTNVLNTQSNMTPIYMYYHGC